MGSTADLNSKEKMLLKFMKKTIENVNICLAGQHTLYRLLISKGVITESELVAMIKEAKNLPIRKLGVEALKDMLNPDWEQYIDFQKTEQNLVRKVEQDMMNDYCVKIVNLVLPAHWVEEGVQPPNSTAKRNACHVCHEMFNKHSMIPFLVACTKEDGVYIRYLIGTKSIIIEAYNDGEIGAVVNDDEKKKILHSSEIKDYNFETCVSILNNPSQAI
jgi:hypothetical protein